MQGRKTWREDLLQYDAMKMCAWCQVCYRQINSWIDHSITFIHKLAGKKSGKDTCLSRFPLGFTQLESDTDDL